MPLIRRHRRGFTIVEFALASTIATVIGGVILTLMSSVRGTYTVMTVQGELSSSVEAGMEWIKRDIWAAGGAVLPPPTGRGGDGLCGTDTFLTLTRASDSKLISYCFDNSDSDNVRLRRTVDGDPPFNVAHHLSVDSQQTTATVSGNTLLISVKLTSLKTVDKRPYSRQVSASYRRQMDLP